MLRRFATLTLAGLLVASAAHAYVEAPHSLGQICKESTHIVLMEVAKVDKTKNLIIYKKLQDLKGQHPADQIKHNIGQRGFAPREWQNVMNWAAEGKKGVFFHNGGASETCIDTYWYQAYPEGEWWGLSHAEPFLLRTFHGDPEKLAGYVQKILAGQEVIVPCLADGDKNQFHNRKGKLQQMRASLKRDKYDAKRDFVAFGAGDGDDTVVVEFKSVTLMPQSSAGWKFVPATQVANAQWQQPTFDDKGWRDGQSPIGYGEEEIAKRKGVTIAEKGQAFLFRRSFEVNADLIGAKGAIFRVSVASDNSAEVFLNGQPLEKDVTEDHEFTYWNHEIDLEGKQLKAGKNVLAVLVKNAPNSSDLYFDLEVTAQVPLPPPPKPAANTNPNQPKPMTEPEKPGQVLVDKAAKRVTVDCAVAPRKLPNLNEVYPIEVIASYPAPRGQKAHETVVTIPGIKPTQVHKALEEIGLKAGKPAKGEGAKAEGAEVKLFLEVPGADGKPQKVPVESLLVDRRDGKTLPPFTWHFTGSIVKQLDPEKDQKDYAADFTGTLIALFPVTDETVIQTSLTMKDEPMFKLEVAKDKLPKEGTPLKLIIEAK